MNVIAGMQKLTQVKRPTKAERLLGRRIIPKGTRNLAVQSERSRVAKKTAVKKKSRGPNKSQAIRDYLKTHPKAGPTEVVNELKKKGRKITPALVSNVKAAMLGKKRGAGRGRGASIGKNDQVSLAALVEARDFVDRVGGIAKAEKILKALQKLG